MTRAGALQGVKVIDFSAMMAGPYCARYLADLGADVIKVEPPRGEYMRNRPPFAGDTSSYFGHLNCGKRSVTLDLKRPEQHQQALDIIRQSDVLVENFRPGIMQRLRLGYEDCHRINPRIIYCSISGFGQSGPDASRPAFAQIIHAESGYDVAFARYQGSEATPPNCAFFTADVLGAVYAFAAINAALFNREHTNKGQHIDVALMDCIVNLMVGDFQHAQFPNHVVYERYGPIKAKDGLVIVVPVIEEQFHALCRALGHPEWLTDERFALGQNRRKNWGALMSLVQEWTVLRPADQCIQFFSDAGIPSGRYRTVADLLDSSQFDHRGSFVRVNGDLDSFLVPNLPFQMSNSRVEAGRHVPALGEHTEEVLRETISHQAPGEKRKE